MTASEQGYEVIEGGLVPVKAWIRGVPVEDVARKQLVETASLPIVHPYVAVMPDVHWGMGATVGSVVPTRGAIVPACVGVDLGCGMTASPTTLTSADLGDNARAIFNTLEGAIPHGRTDNGGPNDRGAWSNPPDDVAFRWSLLKPAFDRIEMPSLLDRAPRQLGTLGTGNHFVEVCLDETDRVWLMLHSGSRGVGNAIGSRFIALAKKRYEAEGITLPNRDLAWLPEGTPEFSEYIRAVTWAQAYAHENRRAIMAAAESALRKLIGERFALIGPGAVECHHNYVARESHFGEELYITRKGAVSARLGELGIIPGSMGAKSFIVRGKGNPDSFHTCSHGAGRVMSRGAAKKAISLEQHAIDTAGVVCRKDADVLDESPRAYKNVDDVMAAQADLIEIVHTLKGVVCVKG
jgi:tRNA-splicing ligase RtcB (3'-phosphate/5'-hydroxy nucleic acid ligase)